MGKRGIIKYIILIVAFIAVMAALIVFFSSRSAVEYSAPARPVEVMRPEIRTIRETIELTGYIEAEAMIPVVPFVSGTIESYPIKAGDTVAKDDVIAEIDRKPYELQKAQAEAAYLGLESSFQRVSALYEKGAATKQDYDALEAQLGAVKAQLVTAPVSGTVLMAPSAAGSIASSESPLAVIADLSDLIVSVKVGERYFSAIADKQDALGIEISTPDGGFSEAEIVSVSPYIDPTSKTFEMKVRLLSPEGFIPGMFVRISIILSETESYALPSYASMAGSGLYMLSVDGKAAEYAAIDAGISDGSWSAVPAEYASRLFIVRGLDGIVSGMPVSVVGGMEE